MESEESGTSDRDQERFHLCMTCGHLKHERLFEVGDCTCQDCYDEVDRGYRGDSAARYREAPDGEGFVLEDENP